MAEIVPVVSEALEAQVRDLLPSQRGFGEDLQASNVITPIIDLTATAQGTTTPEYLQRAFDYTIDNVSIASGAEATITSTPGFYQINYRVLNPGASAGYSMRITDGVTPKIVWSEAIFANTAQSGIAPIMFVASGNTLTWINGTGPGAVCYFRQVADVNGNLVNPQGFMPQ